MSLIDRALRIGEQKKFKEFQQQVARINDLEPEMELLEDHEIREEYDKLRERAAAGEPLEELLFECFALTREAAKRSIGMRHFDVQLIGGMVLHDGSIAEMKTGEGKLRDLPGDLLEPLLDASPELVTDRDVAALDLDAHHALLRSLQRLFADGTWGGNRAERAEVGDRRSEV